MYFLKESFQKGPYERTLFVKNGDKGKILIVYLYVDDLIFTGNNKAMFEEFRKSMMIEFKMYDISLIHYFLHIEVLQYDNGIFISQKKYIQGILNRF